MTIKTKTILFSVSGLALLIASVIIFRSYRATNDRLYQTSIHLDMVDHAAHEIAIEMLLDLRDVDSLRKDLEDIPSITGQLQDILPGEHKPAELISLEISFVRVRRIVNNLKPGLPISKPLLEQVRNEVEKIGANVAILKSLSEKEIDSLQNRVEFMITGLVVLLLAYIAAMFVLLLKTVTGPLLVFSHQVEKVSEGELKRVEMASHGDEIGQLADGFNQLLEKRQQAEKELKREIVEHKEALEKVKLLSGFLPICASCKKIRDDRGYWNQIEAYIRENSEVEFSHSICPDCAKKLYPEFRDKEENKDLNKKH